MMRVLNCKLYTINKDSIDKNNFSNSIWFSGPRYGNAKNQAKLVSPAPDVRRWMVEDDRSLLSAYLLQVIYLLVLPVALADCKEKQ